MSYSVAVKEVAKAEDIGVALDFRFKETYTDPSAKLTTVFEEVKSAVVNLAWDVYGHEPPEGFLYAASVSGHVKTGDEDTAPEFVSVQVSLNPKPEPVVTEGDSPEAVKAGVAKKEPVAA